MKKLFGLILIFALAGLAYADDHKVSFTWDPNTESDLAGYRLYQSTEPGVYKFGPDSIVKEIPAGTETAEITVSHPDESVETTYYWVLTAFDEGGNESGPSNEVKRVLGDAPPDSPTGLISTAIEKIVAILNRLVADLRVSE